MSTHPSCQSNPYLRSAKDHAARQRIRKRLNAFPKVTNLSLGPIVRLHHAPGYQTVELPLHRSKMHGPLVAHPRLIKVDPAFCDDTIDDGETFFCGAHHCEWAEGKKWAPYQVTHIASGLRIGPDFESLSDANAFAARLAAAPGIDWAAVDADHTSAEARPSMERLLGLLKEWGMR